MPTHNPVRARILGGTALLAGLLASVLPAQAADAPAITAQQVIERNAAARGGLEAWRRVQSLQTSGTMDANLPMSLRPDNRTLVDKQGKVLPQPEGLDKVVSLPYARTSKRPHSSRVELVVDGKTAVQIYDGSTGWKQRPFLNRTDFEAYTPAEQKLAAQEPELDGYLIDAARKKIAVVVEGTDVIEGRKAYRLKVTPPGADGRHIWVDAQTFLEVRFEGMRRLDGKQHTVYTYLRDYKDFNGLKLPTLTETVTDGLPGSEKLRVEKVVVNPAVDEALFHRPTASH